MTSKRQPRPARIVPAGSSKENTTCVRTRGGFDYTGIAPSHRAKAEGAVHAIRRLLVETATNIIQIGRHLNSVREAIGREHFQAWLVAEFDWSQPTASRYMSAADVFGNVDCVNRFQPSALYVLAKRKVPERARAEALKRARAGEVITQKGALRLIQECSNGVPILRRSPQAQAIAATVQRLESRFQKMDAGDRHFFLQHLAALLKRLQNGEPDSLRERPLAAAGQPPKNSQ